MDKELVGFVVGNFAIIAFFTWIFVHYRAKRQQQMAEERLRLLDRFESAQEVTAFLESGTGRRVLDSLGTRRADPRRSILVVLPLGLVALLIGLGLAFAIHLGALDDGLAFLAVVCTASGIGILISVLLSQRLARNWGMFDHDPPGYRPNAQYHDPNPLPRHEARPNDARFDDD